MKTNVAKLLLACRSVNFGKCRLSKMEKEFYRRFSNEIVSLGGSLPKSVQTEAMLFLLRYSGVKLDTHVDFFANYYPPTWSILYWLSNARKLPRERLKAADVQNAVTAQSMAMFLHSLDDHLTDGQVPVSPLTLLLRNRAWNVMNSALSNLADCDPLREGTVQSLIDRYYSSILDSQAPKSVDAYCELFRGQMATGMIAPIILSLKMTGISDLVRDVEIAYGSFGVAWRLLDDIRDIEDDIKKGAHSAIYLCLPEESRTHWDDNAAREPTAAKESTRAILNRVLDLRLIDRIKRRICAELEKAASLAAGHGMRGLATEFRCLAYPLRENSGDREGDNGTPRRFLAS